MVQVLEQVQEIILEELPEVEEVVKESRIIEIKAKLNKVKDYAKKHEYNISIRDLKNKMDAKLYSENFRFF